MAFPLPGHTKWRMACGLAIGLAAVAQRAGDPVGAAIVAGAGTARVRARNSIRHARGDPAHVLWYNAQPNPCIAWEEP